MSNSKINQRKKYDLNEFLFYTYMPDSNVLRNDHGYFLKNNTIDTYSYVTPTQIGSSEFNLFLEQCFSFFDEGKKYFIVKIPHDSNYNYNSKVLRTKRFLRSLTDVNVMFLSNFDKIRYFRNRALQINELTEKDYVRWLNVFFDAFQYPRNLKKYISEMVLLQMKNNIHFYVGNVSGKDVSCFCSMKTEQLIGVYGVGTKRRFQRRGYAKAMLSNFISEKMFKDKKTEFCLQTVLNSKAEHLYRSIGFEQVYIQRRFEWNPTL
ncbi:MAG: GNAT family N-acetyltransferase [Candidatus Heimdallarchaeum endolithica]|uniref:GNAT family N-acetyltransferase n=1 Tax=Candidatus Heimdallarchaeum endolithica TaxID=2876572 RepID=A0A9Y1BQC8_9ARCH|nr:MAG: GNAT family N-acetyltransferase [Candidatus Heimdallarchaeum endolithica]